MSSRQSNASRERTISTSADKPAVATVRPSTLSDLDGINALWSRAGFCAMDRADYEHRYAHNPADPRPQDQRTTGWVMDAAGTIVGSIGNIYSAYEFNGRRLLAASAHAVAVDEPYRKQSLPLLASFFRQGNTDLLLSTTANEAASKVYSAFKSVRVPHPDYDQVMYWITRYSGFLRAGLVHRGKIGASKLAPLAWPGLWIADWSRRSIGGDASRTRVLDQFDDRFDALWEKLRQRPDRLLAVRDRQSLAWHFEEGRRQGRLGLVALEDAGAITGYVVLLRRDAPSIGLTRYGIADLQVVRDDAGDVRALLSGALQLARRQGVHVVEATGFEPFKHDVLESTRPRRRTSPSWPFLYKAQKPEWSEALSRASAWDPCPYDGDASF